MVQHCQVLYNVIHFLHLHCHLFIVYYDCIVQGVYARGLLGNASSAQAELFKAVVDPLASLGCSFIRSVDCGSQSCGGGGG